MSLLEEYKSNSGQTTKIEETSKLHKLFLREKPTLIVEAIYEAPGEVIAYELQRTVDTTYAHAVKQLSRLEDHGLIRKQKSGRKKKIKLTEKGETVAEKLVELDNTLFEANTDGGDQ